MFRICLFGTARFFIGEEPYRWSARPMVLPLLAYLLLHRDAPVDRMTLAFALWPDDDEAHARGNLRRHIHYLQEALPTPPAELPWILTTATTLQWNHRSGATIDVHEFDRLRADRASRAEAAALYGGDLLVALSDEWLIAPREHYAAVFNDLLAALIELESSRHDIPHAIAYARQLLARDPWREDAVRHLMTLKLETGDRAGAVAEYERFAGALKAELDVDPMVETTAIFNSIARGDSPGGKAKTPLPASSLQKVGLATQTPFLGRDEELGAVKSAWDRAARGAGMFVLIGGEAGIGKSRLAQEAALLITRQRGRVFAGETSNVEIAPYQALAQALAEAAPLARQVELEPVWLAALATIMPEFAAASSEKNKPASLEPQRQRMRLFEACAAFWQAVARLAPCCLIFEDLHWAGPDTIDALSYLARRLRDHPILLIATYRDEGLARDHPLRALRRSLHEARATHIALRRLTSQAVHELVRARTGVTLAPDTSTRVYERSEGNPLYAMSLIELLERTGDGGEDFQESALRLASATVPPGIEQALSARYAGLSDAASFVAQIASVIGRSFDIELLQEVTGHAASDLLDALGDLLDRKIVAEAVSGVHWRYEFTHEMLQSAAYGLIDPARRVARHRRVAQVMETLYAGQADEIAERVALHWDLGDEPARAAPWYLRAATRAASVYANHEAVTRAGRALALTPDPSVRIAALRLRELVADRLGDRESQRRDLDELDAMTETHADPNAEAETLYRRLLLAKTLSDHAAHASLARRLLYLARRDGLMHWRAPALISIAGLASASGDYGRARRALRPLLRSSGNGPEKTPWQFEAWRTMADAAIFEGNLDEAQRALIRARKLAEGDSDLAAIARTSIGIARAALAKQNYPLMADSAKDALRIATTIGDRLSEAFALHTMANGAVYPFRIADARRLYDEAASLYDAMDYRMGQAGLLVDRGLFLTELGLFDAAEQAYARADEIAAAIDYNWVRCVVAINGSYCARLRGDAGGAKASAGRAVALAKALKSRQLLAAALGTLGAAERALGDANGAIEHLEEGVRLRRPDGATPRLGDNLSHLAVAYADAGRIADSLAVAQEVVEMYDQAPDMPPQPTEWLWNAAQAYRAAADTGRARAVINRAAAVARKRASLISDERVRRAFLGLPFNRAVRSEARRKARC